MPQRAYGLGQQRSVVSSLARFPFAKSSLSSANSQVLTSWSRRDQERNVITFMKTPLHKTFFGCWGG